MWEWVRTWTFFNWLSIIAFILAIVGFLNSFLSLKARWKDWRSLRSQVLFTKRLKELQDYKAKIKIHQAEPIKFIIDLLYELSLLVTRAALILLSYCFLYLFFINFPILQDVSIGLTLVMVLYPLAVIVMLANRIKYRINYFYKEELIDTSIKNLIESGKKSGFLNESFEVASINNSTAQAVETT